MSKVVICGIKKSGKTCYFYGMLRSLMIGKAGFSVAPLKENFNSIRLATKRLADTSLPLSDRFPESSTQEDVYHMNLFYRLRSISEFDWVDYPGEWVSTAQDGFLKHLDDADALLICVDGELFQGIEDDVDDIIYQLQNDCGGYELNHALMTAQREKQEQGGDLPPVCIMITKFDKVSPDLMNPEILEEQIIKQAFPILFDSEKAKVAICPVSLGREIEKGGKLEPKNVEIPVLYALYWEILNNYSKMHDELNSKNGEVKAYQQAKKDYDGKSALERFFSIEPTLGFTEEDYKKVVKKVEQLKKDCNAILNWIDIISLYEGGEKKDWADYYLE